MEKLYVEKFVTFAHYGNGWTGYFWDTPPAEKHWRIRIPVPQELLAPVIELTDVEAYIEGPPAEMRFEAPSRGTVGKP